MKQKKHFKELSDEDLKQVTGGGYVNLINPDNIKLNSLSSSAPIDPSLTPGATQQAAEPCPANQISFTDMYGEQICIPA